MLTALCVIGCVGCADNDSIKPPTEIPDGALILHNVRTYPEYAVLPICDVITSLGIELTWDGLNFARFNYCGSEYVINLAEKTLTKEGNDENYLICPPGNDHLVCELESGVLMVDDSTVRSLFNSVLDFPIDIIIDHEKNRVGIIKR